MKYRKQYASPIFMVMDLSLLRKPTDLRSLEDALDKIGRRCGVRLATRIVLATIKELLG